MIHYNGDVYITTMIIHSLCITFQIDGKVEEEVPLEESIYEPCPDQS